MYLVLLTGKITMLGDSVAQQFQLWALKKDQIEILVKSIARVLTVQGIILFENKAICVTFLLPIPNASYTKWMQ